MIYKIQLRIVGDAGEWKEVHVKACSIEAAMKKAVNAESDEDIKVYVTSAEETNIELVE